jgi:hypothetical protein
LLKRNETYRESIRIKRRKEDPRVIWETPVLTRNGRGRGRKEMVG